MPYDAEPWQFSFYRSPRAHQARDFARFKDAEYFALLWEPRCGKTKLIYDIFQYRYALGHVDALVVVAFPNGVHRVWLDELPKELPPDLLARTAALAWASGKTTRGAEREAAIAIRAHDGPIVVTLNCEAIITEKGWKYLEWLLRKRRVMLVADEASWAANWSARTKKLEALGRGSRDRPRPVVRAILDGTPVEEGPVEIYHPARFLDPTALGYPTKEAFKARYLQFEEAEDEHGVRRRVMRQRHEPGTGRVIGEYPVFRGYRNLDELYDRLMRFSSRVRRADVSDAPPKVYQTVYFELTPVQRRVYDDLRDRYVAEVDADREVRAANVLLRMTRLQMVARNYYPPERRGELCVTCQGQAYTEAGDHCVDCDGLGYRVVWTELTRIDPRRNPAIDALVYQLTNATGPVVVWCRFRQDVEDVWAAANGLGRRLLPYHGGLKESLREENYRAFRAGTGDGLVGTIASGLSRGHDLTRATTVIYYSNEFGLRLRRQSEDRAEGVARAVSTDVIDLVAADTRDLAVIEALRAKRSIAAAILGDPDGAWI